MLIKNECKHGRLEKGKLRMDMFGKLLNELH